MDYVPGGELFRILRKNKVRDRVGPTDWSTNWLTLPSLVVLRIRGSVLCSRSLIGHRLPS
jgi:hypothetical protein